MSEGLTTKLSKISEIVPTYDKVIYQTKSYDLKELNLLVFELQNIVHKTYEMLNDWQEFNEEIIQTVCDCAKSEFGTMDSIFFQENDKFQNLSSDQRSDEVKQRFQQIKNSRDKARYFQHQAFNYADEMTYNIEFATMKLKNAMTILQLVQSRITEWHRELTDIDGNIRKNISTFWDVEVTDYDMSEHLDLVKSLIVKSHNKVIKCIHYFTKANNRAVHAICFTKQVTSIVQEISEQYNI